MPLSFKVRAILCSRDSGLPHRSHGSSIATLARSGSSWSVGDERAYDAWGRIRQGGQTGAPSARYCASLGHVQDDESGLVYMRARYYEPGTGRFLSEDPILDGGHWYAYAQNDPINFSDRDGRSASDVAKAAARTALLASSLCFLVDQLLNMWNPTGPEAKAFKNFVAAVSAGATAAMLASSALDMSEQYAGASKLGYSVGAMVGGAASAIILTLGIRQLLFMMFMIADDNQDDKLGGYTDSLYDLNPKAGLVF